MQEYENGPEWEKKQRMQAKAWLCVIGIILLIFLTSKYLQPERDFEPMKEPVISYLHNVYIENVTDTYITVFDGESKNIAWQENYPVPDVNVIGRIANITVQDGFLLEITLQDEEKINDKVVSVEADSGVELEDYGLLPFSENAKIYMLYGELRTGTARDIRIGYEFADFVIKDGKICAVLLTRDETMEHIRVLIKNSNYAGDYHETVTLSSDADFIIKYGAEDAMTEEVHKAGEQLTLSPDSTYFADGTGRVYIVPTTLTGKVNLYSVNRSQGTPSYRGSMEIRCTDKGLVVINEVLLEEYLYAVVPSEMPASYPLEALKAQAICARTYAYAHMLSPGLPGLGAHVDDSTGYQVYNNITEQSATTTAIKETAGQLLYSGGNLVSTYYYSTSCGFGSDEHVWKSDAPEELPYLAATSVSETAVDNTLSMDVSVNAVSSVYTGENMQREEVFAQFLTNPPETDFEKKEAWYRWWYNVPDMDSDRILEVLKARYAANNKLVLTLQDGKYVSTPIEKLGDIKKITVAKRNAGGVADELVIEGEDGTYKVISELYIRYVLCDGITQVKRQDGSMVEMASLLPSGYFILAPIFEGENMVGYKLYGGGFGHGVGMSQNGAKNMANAGYTAQQILEFFYKESTVTTAIAWKR